MRHKPPVRWSRRAIRDLDLAYAYLAERNPEAARQFSIEIHSTVDRIERHPEIGAVARDLAPPGRYRHLFSGRHRIIYRIDTDALWILRVWDSRRNPADLRPE